MHKWRPQRVRKLLFRIFYSTSYTVVFLLIVAFAVVVAADAIYQAYKVRRLIDIFILAGVYVLTALLATLIYASRLYTNRSVIKDIPKTYIPIEKGDLPNKHVRKMIETSLTRSAVIAYSARPRSDRVEEREPTARGRIAALNASSEKKGYAGEPTWGKVAHPGWSSPASADLPNLQYATVIVELADLIEARAVSLAPSDPGSTPNMDGTPMPDERVVETLQRPADMGLRQYVGQLIDLQVIEDPFIASQFLTLYERARFAPDPLTEVEFRGLMNVFAEILRSMTSLDPEYYPQFQVDEDDYSGSDSLSGDSLFYDTGSVRRMHVDDGAPPRISEDSTPSLPTDNDDERDGRSLRTAPDARSVSRATKSTRMVSAASRRALQRQKSSTSAVSSGSSRSGGSVIRLADAGMALPYTLLVPDA